MELEFLPKPEDTMMSCNDCLSEEEEEEESEESEEDVFGTNFKCVI